MIPSPVEGRSLRFPGQEITWAGECPWTGGFCFGTESGDLLICGGTGESDLNPFPIHVASEAINDVAYSGDLVGVSTRSEVIVGRRGPSDAHITLLSKAGQGAHGIVASPRGRFLAPMGPSGLLLFDPERAKGERFSIDKPAQGIYNFYRLIYLENRPSLDILACAARTSGLLRIQSEADQPSEIVGWASPNVDFIDVCSVQSAEWPHAVVGLSLDRSLVFIRDLFAGEAPLTLHLGELRGTPYSILNADRCLVILTSKELVAFPDLLSSYLAGEPLDRPFRYRATPLQPVDVSVAYGEHVVVVMDEEVRLFEIRSLARPIVGATPEDGHPDVPDWEEREQWPTFDKPSWASLSPSA